MATIMAGAAVAVFSKQLVPIVSRLASFLSTPIEVQAWILGVLPLLSAAVSVIVLFGVNHIRRKRNLLVFAGIRWRSASDNRTSIEPMCERCWRPLQSETEPEKRLDRNGLAFEFTPHYANTLRCLNCSMTTRLPRPWEDIKREAELFFSSMH